MTVFDMARGQPERIMTSSDSPGWCRSKQQLWQW